MEKKGKNKIALITGASSGIGASFARFLAKRGYRVVLTARRRRLLEDLVREIQDGAGAVDFFVCDIGKPKEREKLVVRIHHEIGPIDVLINNAGFGWYGYFYRMAWSDAAQMLAVNVEAAAHLTRLILPKMIERARGHVIHIGSIAGGLPNQGIAMYSASKAFLDAFNSSLYRELKGSGVYSSIMRLGPVRTEFYEQARQKENGSPVPAEKMAISVERVNQALWKLLNHPRRVMYVPVWLGVSRLVELMFGGLIDQLGPLLLRREK
jgi:short-subunit dehydrogenase